MTYGTIEVDNLLPGDDVAIDTIGSTKFQRVKIAYGAEGSATDVDSTNRLPISTGTPSTGNTEIAEAIGQAIGATATGIKVLAEDSSGNAQILTLDSAGRLTVEAALSATDNAVLDTIETNTDFGAVTGGGTEAGALRVTLASDSTGVLSIDDGGGTITVDGTVTANLSATDNAVLDNIQTAVETIDNAISGSVMQVDVVGSLPTGASLIGDVGLSGARTSGGTTIFRSIDLDESEEEVKGSAGQIYWIHCINLANAVRYLKIYNATAASVTVGTTTPVLTFPIPTQGDTNGAGFNFAVPNGIALGTAITVAATTGVADSDTGAPGANEVIINLGYA